MIEIVLEWADALVRFRMFECVLVIIKALSSKALLNNCSLLLSISFGMCMKLNLRSFYGFPDACRLTNSFNFRSSSAFRNFIYIPNEIRSGAFLRLVSVDKQLFIHPIISRRLLCFSRKKFHKTHRSFRRKNWSELSRNTPRE